MRRRAWVLSIVCVFVVALVLVACGSNSDTPNDDSTILAPMRKDSGSADDASGPSSSPDANADSSDVDDGAFKPRTCGVMNGLYVICMRQGESFEAFASLTYGPGFPDNLPAMGLGKTQLGYLPADYPFTCIAKGEVNAKSVNNTSSGKICEVVFDNKVTTTVKGSGTYTITIDQGAKLGTYDVAYLANTGATPEVPGFYVKVEP